MLQSTQITKKAITADLFFMLLGCDKWFDQWWMHSRNSIWGYRASTHGHFQYVLKNLHHV